MTVTQAIREEAELIGEKRGKKEGMQQGMQTRSLEIARTMLQKREPQEKVVEFTGLSKMELEQLIRDIGLN